MTGTEHGMIGSVPAITKHLVGHPDNSSYPLVSVNIALTLKTPADASRPVPVIMQFGFDPAFMKQFLARMKARGVKLPPRPAGPTWQQQVLARGWGYAVLVATSIQPDNGAGLSEGIIGLSNHGQPRKPDDWGALRAWAWGASRAMDYFESDPAVDARHVGIEGHSRYGKAALVTMAYDQRFAIGYISSSGKGGAAPYRRHFGEEVGNVAGAGEYHWMAGNFLKYDGPLTVNDLPVDTNELIALCAPRPIFISAGTLEKGDGWVDARGMFMAAAGSSSVYELLGEKGLQSSTFPPTGTPLLAGDIAFRQHHQGHTDLPNWPWFLQFASRYIPSAPARSAAAR